MTGASSCVDKTFDVVAGVSSCVDMLLQVFLLVSTCCNMPTHERCFKRGSASRIRNEGATE